ncbi:MAG TPA: hypothetical protein PLF40_27865, partial [Kofleriaceae bacterium]|nr:hypothetical protein [Kofleriaceae bacterium]
MNSIALAHANGAPLLLSIDVRHSDRGQRLLVNRIEPLEEAAQGVRPTAISLKVDELDELPRLKQMLGSQVERGAKVELL